jgi:hypothetical protein
MYPGPHVSLKFPLLLLITPVTVEPWPRHASASVKCAYICSKQPSPPQVGVSRRIGVEPRARTDSPPTYTASFNLRHPPVVSTSGIDFAAMFCKCSLMQITTLSEARQLGWREGSLFAVRPHGEEPPWPDDKRVPHHRGTGSSNTSLDPGGGLPSGSFGEPAEVRAVRRQAHTGGLRAAGRRGS